MDFIKRLFNKTRSPNEPVEKATDPQIEQAKNIPLWAEEFVNRFGQMVLRMRAGQRVTMRDGTVYQVDETGAWRNLTKATTKANRAARKARNKALGVERRLRLRAALEGKAA